MLSGHFQSPHERPLTSRPLWRKSVLGRTAAFTAFTKEALNIARPDRNRTAAEACLKESYRSADCPVLISDTTLIIISIILTP